MANPSKKKGTGGENEVLKVAEDIWGEGCFARTSPGMPWDVERKGYSGPGNHNTPLELLATRPDHGEWLVTMRLDDALRLAHGDADFDDDIRIEVKRYARFALHSIWNKKFGGKGLTYLH